MGRQEAHPHKPACLAFLMLLLLWATCWFLTIWGLAPPAESMWCSLLCFRLLFVFVYEVSVRSLLYALYPQKLCTASFMFWCNVLAFLLQKNEIYIYAFAVMLPDVYIWLQMNIYGYSYIVQDHVTILYWYCTRSWWFGSWNAIP